MSVFLAGMPGAGKTSVAAYLSDKYGLTSVDTDDLVTQIAGKTIPDIFAHEGEAAFRQWELEAIHRSLEKGYDLIALGGGALSYPASVGLVRGHETVYLKATPRTSAKRVAGANGRPLLAKDPLEALQHLYAQRTKTFSELATAQVETDGRSIASVAEEVMSCQHELIAVDGPTPYAVRIGRAIAKQKLLLLLAAGNSKAFLIAPQDLKCHYLPLASALEAHGIFVKGFIAPNAEAQKTVECLSNCWDTLGLERFGRKDTVVGLGGGATTDLSGFVAATWMRGVDHIAISTSLLGMVDAAVGGKTGINTSSGKNMVGAFWTPRAVVCDLDYLQTLPPQDFVEGLGEVVKCGFIADPRILELLDEEHICPTSQNLPEIISRAIRVKADVVGKDLREGGLREILNYGHTFAHAIEKVERYRFRHGNAVSVGMMFAAHVAHKLEMIDTDLLERHRKVLAAAGLPTSYRGGDFATLLDAMRADKKVRNGKIRMVLLRDLAQPVTVPIEDIAVLEYAFRKVAK